MLRPEDLDPCSEVKAFASNAGDPGSIPGSGRSPREGNGNPLHYYLENPMDGGTWYAIVHRVAKSRTQLSHFTFTLKILVTLTTPLKKTGLFFL